MSFPAPLMEDWLRGWREWARTRKRGKMAQFIVEKLEASKQARWLDITRGKFELTEWHALADEWFRQKPRNADLVDAPCMLRKGLPRAFPGLEEVKTESVKEGTQYRSRVFIAPHELLEEVLSHITHKGSLGYTFPDRLIPPEVRIDQYQAVYSSTSEKEHRAVDRTSSESGSSLYPPSLVYHPQQLTIQEGQERLQMRPFPNKSLLKGGGEICLVFYSQLPPGNKWITFMSQTHVEFTTTVEAYQENSMALRTFIPKHAVAETVSLQVICNAQIIASSDFTYYEDANSLLQVKEKEEEEADEGLSPETESHGASSAVPEVRVEKVEDDEPPLSHYRPQVGGFSSFRSQRKMLITTHSDADSAVSMSFDRDEMELELNHRARSTMGTSGLYSLNLTEPGTVDVAIDKDAGYTFANALQYEHVFLVTEDFPPGEDNVIFRAGDQILAIGDTLVRGKTPDDFAELLQTEAVRGTTVRVAPRLAPPPSSFSTASSLDHPECKLVRRQNEQLLDSITVKVSNLLSMRTCGPERKVTLPFEGGYGFKVIGGNIVGLFVSEVRPSCREVSQGDQILEINGTDSRHMTHNEASQLLRSSYGPLSLVVMENCARFATIRDQFEFDSFYLRCNFDHTPSDHKDMHVHRGMLVRVVNTILYGGNHWLAWAVSPRGFDTDLRRIPSSSRAKVLSGEQPYHPDHGDNALHAGVTGREADATVAKDLIGVREEHDRTKNQSGGSTQFSGQSEGKQDVPEGLASEEPESPVKSKLTVPHPPEPEPHPPDPEHISKSEPPVKSKLSVLHPPETVPYPLASESQVHPPEVSEGKPPHSSGMTGHKEAPTQEMILGRESVPDNHSHLVGVDMIAETTFMIGSDACTFQLKGCGVKLHIPQDSLPADCQKCMIRIGASLSGQFKLPPSCRLVSGVYWVHCPVKLSKNVTLEVQHCSTQTEDLRFVWAESIKEPLAPYLFKILEGGEFPRGSTHGSIELPTFSLFGIIFMWCASFIYPYSYSAKVYRSLTEVRHIWKIYFTIKRDLDLEEEAFCSRLEGETRQSIYDIVIPPFPVKFAASQVKLEIQDFSDGWELTCPISPVIERSIVDNFRGRTGDILPLLQMNATFTGGETERTLKRRIDLEGVQDPHRFFVLQCCEPTTSLSGAIPLPSISSMTLVTPIQASRVFLEKCPIIRTGILNSVHGIAPGAYARGLISDVVHRTVTDACNHLTVDERTDIFLNELESRIKIDASVLATFVDVLRQSDPVYHATLIRTITEGLRGGPTS